MRGEQYTNYMRWDLTGPEFNLTSPVEGQRWNPEDIVIVGDGMCSSTCTLFVSAMVAAGVRTVTYGGRPQRGPMQIIGGVEGSQVLTFDDIWELSHEAMQRAMAKLNRTVMQDPNSNDNPTITTTIELDGSEEKSFGDVDHDESTVEHMLAHLPRRKLRGKGVINLRNAFDPGRDVPREFVYRANDYRLPMKREEWERIEVLWKRVAQEVWHI